jgi:hypothetical protein
MNKADQLLQNEARKIRTKIEGKKREIKKLEFDLQQIEARIKK